MLFYSILFFSFLFFYITLYYISLYYIIYFIFYQIILYDIYFIYIILYYASFRRGSLSSARRQTLALQQPPVYCRRGGARNDRFCLGGAKSRRGERGRWQEGRWGLAVQLLQAAIGARMHDDFVVTVDAWPRLAGRPLGPRGRRLPADEAWYYVAPRLPPQVAALAFAPRVQSHWWLEESPHLGSEELGESTEPAGHCRGKPPKSQLALCLLTKRRLMSSLSLAAQRRTK